MQPPARLAVTILLACAAGACSLPPVLLPTAELLRDVYAHGLANSAAVALTFDDGPNGRCTAEILDALAESATPATFFVLGANIARDDNRALVARMVREGHEVGLHGWAHSPNPLFKESWAQADIDQTRDAVVEALLRAGITGVEPRFYRPPFGFLTAPAAHAAATRHLTIVEWTVSVEDWRGGRSAVDLADAVVAETRPGDVIVLHDGNETVQRSAGACVDRPRHADAVRHLVPALAAHGLHVARLADVLASPLQSH